MIILSNIHTQSIHIFYNKPVKFCDNKNDWKFIQDKNESLKNVSENFLRARKQNGITFVLKISDFFYFCESFRERLSFLRMFFQSLGHISRTRYETPENIR